MVIVIGSLHFAPEDRDAFIASRLAGMKHSRAENGCITYTMTPDPIDDTLVVLTERWVDRAALDAHIAAIPNAPKPDRKVSVVSRVIHVYEADDGTLL